MKIYQQYRNQRTGESISFRDMARSIGLKDEIEEGTRIKWKGEYYIVYDINPKNTKFPVLIKNRDVKLKATVALVNNAEIIVY